jgi:putative ATP-binding cassette transporter
MRSLNHSMWSRLVAVGLPYYRSEARRRALGASAVLVTLLVTINGMNVVNSYVGRDFMSALAERHAGRFYVFAGILVGVFAALTVVEVFARYAEQWLGLAWREWLTRRFLDRYLAGRAYLRLADRHDIDNPDERISEDVKTFTATTLSILVLLVNGLLTLVAFSGVLWSITPWLFLTALGYAAAGSLGTVLLGRRLVTLQNQQLQKEADFRYGLGRVREHAEAVAQVGGEEEQKGRLGRRLSSLVGNFRAVIGVSRNLGFFTTGYKYLPQIIPAALVAPLYIRGAVEFGAVTQAAMAFAQVQGAFALIVTQFQEVTTYAAVIGRLGVLWEATEPGVAGPAPAGPLPRTPAGKAPPPGDGRPGAPAGPVVETSPDARRVVYEHLTLWAPGEERPLVRDLSVEVPEGQRVALTGPGRAGKAALLATAGLWQEGRGRISRPGPGGVMFVPRRPYAASGRLRDILLDGLGRDLPDDRLRAVLGEVGVGEVVGREGGLGAERDWATVLTPGQLQALTFARLLLAGPRFAFLEDPAGALEAPLGERLYQALARSPITYVSVGCPPALLPYHDRRLEVQEDGSWRVEPAGPGLTCRCKQAMASSERVKSDEVPSEARDHAVQNQGREGDKHAPDRQAQAGRLAASKHPADEAHQ